MRSIHFQFQFFTLALALSLLGCRVDSGIPPVGQSETIVEESSFIDTAPAPVTKRTETVPDQYLITFRKNAILNTSTNRLATAQKDRSVNNPMAQDEYDARNEWAQEQCKKFLAEHNIAPDALIRAYSNAVEGMAVKLSDQEYTRLSQDDRIEFIEEDKMIAMGEMGPEIKTPFNPADIATGLGNWFQIVPYGVNRVGGSTNYSANTSLSDKWVWIVDTGVDGHSELTLVSSYARNFSSDSHLGDGYGHGTHVAGIVGAKDDGKGVVGVAAGANLVNIKVINTQGDGYYSDIVAALDYIRYNSISGDVVNMSIGGAGSATVDNATRALGNANVYVAVAAGNKGDNVSSYSPARVSHSKVYVVSAINYWDQFASFSNYGSNVDYSGPGVAILSTVGTDQLAYMTGTSMATPHIAGVLLVAGENKSSNGYSSSGPDGRALPVISY